MHSPLSYNFETDHLPSAGWRGRLDPIDQVTMLAQGGKAWASFEKEVSVPGPTSTISLSIYPLVFN